VEAALFGRFVGTPANELGAVAKPLTRYVIETYFEDDERTNGMPRDVFRTPTARTARPRAGKARLFL
jgi:hypothetical protein